jgi:S-adenosyl methyltransferase
VALLLIGVLGHVADTGVARGIVARLMEGLAAGSFLVQCDGTDSNPDYVAALERYRDSGGVPYNVRGHDQIVSLYEGLEPVEPGVVQITRWRPEPNAFGEATEVDELGGVARKA